MQRPDTARLTAATGREVALREGFKAVLVGEVSRLGDGYVISAQLLGADSGQVLAGYRETAGNASEIIPAVDRLSRALRRRIGESLARIRANPPLAAVTTGSLDALRQYSLGLRAHRAGRPEDALTLYESATRLDSTFAMAWQGVAIILWNLNRDPGRQQDALTRAYSLRDRLPERERYTTEARYFEEVLGDAPKAREAYRALLALDPQHAAALTNLGLITWFEGDLDEASELAARAIRADSGSIPPYTNLVDAQVSLGDFAAAETTLARWRARFGAHALYDSSGRTHGERAAAIRLRGPGLPAGAQGRRATRAPGEGSRVSCRDRAHAGSSDRGATPGPTRCAARGHRWCGLAAGAERCVDGCLPGRRARARRRATR